MIGKINSSFSVLMSVYIKEKAEFLDLALKSNLEDQNLKPDEFILVCDGPLTKELYEIIDTYRIRHNNVLKVYKLDENVGLGEALNFGLSKCSFEYVIRSDSDDVCCPNRFEKLVRYLDDNPEVVVVSSYIDEFDNDWEKANNVKKIPTKYQDVYNLAKFRNPINHMASAFRKTAVLNVGSYKHLSGAEDYYLWVRLLINGYKIENIDEILVHARVGNGMLSRRANKEYLRTWKILNKYMFNNKMINMYEYLRNMASVFLFIYMPNCLRKILYRLYLRK